MEMYVLKLSSKDLQGPGGGGKTIMQGPSGSVKTAKQTFAKSWWKCS